MEYELVGAAGQINRTVEFVNDPMRVCRQAGGREPSEGGSVGAAAHDVGLLEPQCCFAAEGRGHDDPVGQWVVNCFKVTGGDQVLAGWLCGLDGEVSQ